MDWTSSVIAIEPSAVSTSLRSRPSDEGLERADDIAPHVQKTRTAGPAHIIAARGREHVAAYMPHIDRELA
jgi:hypothetical protein